MIILPVFESMERLSSPRACILWLLSSWTIVHSCASVCAGLTVGASEFEPSCVVRLILCICFS
jgi:hypothetical protein